MKQRKFKVLGEDNSVEMLRSLTITIATTFVLSSCNEAQPQSKGIEISVPDGFFKLSQEQIKLKFGDSLGAPKTVYADSLDRMRITIALGKRPTGNTAALSEVDIPEFKESLAMSRDVKRWHAAEMIDVKGKPAMFLDFESATVESKEYNIRNSMIMYYAKGELNIVNVNCTTDLAATCEKITRSVLDSLSF